MEPAENQIAGGIELAEALKEIDNLEKQRQQQLERADELIAAELERRRQSSIHSKAGAKAR
jgi:Tfp pilus assembly protein PilN